MNNSYLPAESLMVFDVGTASTRAILFDVVEDHYRFIGSGAAPTTTGGSNADLRQGIWLAIQALSEMTERNLMDEEGMLIYPRSVEMGGVDHLAATFSINTPLKLLAVGLHPDFTLESATRLADSLPYRSLERLSLNDNRPVEQLVDWIVGMRPDLILAAGGTDNGASQSVRKLLEILTLSCSLLADEIRPRVLFAGNQALLPVVQSTLGRVTSVALAANVYPDSGREQLGPAQAQLADIYKHLCLERIPRLDWLDRLVEGRLVINGYGLGRLIRFLSKIHSPAKGVLGVDLGASTTTVAAALDSQLTLRNLPLAGLDNNLADAISRNRVEGILQWLGQGISAERLREYLLHKALYPESLPTTTETLAIEQAWAKHRLLQATAGLPSSYEPILATGSVLAAAPQPGQSLLMLLDGLQPAGITTLILDQNLIAPALGAASAAYPGIVVQILDSSAFLHLGTVVAPTGQARSGSPILRVKAEFEQGEETSLEITQGSLHVLPVPIGKTARLQLTPLQRVDIGMGSPGQGGSLRVTGSHFGVIFDARGRPLRLPSDSGARQELFTSWTARLGG